MIFAWGVVPDDFHKRQIPQDLAQRGIAKVVCGQGHAVLLTNTGMVLTAGDNRYGQCARDPANQSLPLSAFNIEGVKIVDVAAGSYHTLLLGEAAGKRKLFTFGHELGSGFEDKQHRSVPTEFALPVGETEKIVGAYAGFNHSAVVTSAGKLFMWGEFFTGERVRRPKQIRTEFLQDKEVKKIALGRKHAVLLESKNHTDDGNVYTWGVNTYGELGQGAVKRITLPQKLEQVRSILDVAAGARHTLMVDSFGSIFAFGDNSQGQCGFDQSRSDVPVEVVTRGYFGGGDCKCRFIYCGETHSALVTSEGEVFAWGDNSALKLGIPVQNDMYAPTLVDAVIGKAVEAVGLGGFFSVIITGPSDRALIKSSTNRLVLRRAVTGLVSGLLGRPTSAKS